MSHVHHLSLSSVVTIGFDATAYTITEPDSSVSRSVSVSVQGSTTLARDVVVTVQTMDGTATGRGPGDLSHHIHHMFTDIVDVRMSCCFTHFIISPSSFI